MKNLILKKLSKSASVYGLAAAKTAHVSPRLPADIELAFRNLKPYYLYEEGARAAFFCNATIWRETGEYGAFYERTVRTLVGVAHEKYAWVLRNGRFVEVRQFGLRDVSRRIFVGV